jgi:hypothetical protein
MAPGHFHPSLMFSGKAGSLSIKRRKIRQGTLKGERGEHNCTVGLLFDLFGLVCFVNKNRCNTADSKPVKQEANSTVILPPLVFPV